MNVRKSRNRDDALPFVSFRFFSVLPNQIFLREEVIRGSGQENGVYLSRKAGV